MVHWKQWRNIAVLVVVLTLSLFVNNQVQLCSVGHLQEVTVRTALNRRNISANTGQPLPHEQPIAFYVYPLDLFPKSWRNCSAAIRSRKHTHLIFALEAMMRHPNRVSSISDAQVAVIPIPLDLKYRGACEGGVHIDAIVDELQMVTSNNIRKVRHLLLANDFKSNSAVQQMPLDGIILAGMPIGRGNCRTSLGYLSNYATLSTYRSGANFELVPNPRRQASERIYSVQFVAQFDTRPAYSDRRALFFAKGTIPNAYMVTQEGFSGQRYSNSRLCNATSCSGAQDFDRCVMSGCPTYVHSHLASELSNYTLCLRGDTLGSDRWIQGMTAGTALIAVVDSNEELDWAPFPFAVPWRDIVITIDRKQFLKDPVASIRKVIDTTSAERLQELQDLSRRYSTELDWTAYASRMLENMIYEAATIPCVEFDKLQQGDTK